jgi:hypothetical protein
MGNAGNVVRVMLGNIQVVFFAGIMLYSVLRRSTFMRRLWRWFWS